MPQRVKLTKAFIEHTPLLESGQVFFWDTELPGFGLLVGRTTRSFVVQRGLRGRAKRFTLGRWPALTVEQARKLAHKTLAQMIEGRDPLQEKRAARDRGITFERAKELFFADCERRGRAPETIQGYKKGVRLYLESWLPKPLAEITRKDVYEKHRAIAAAVAAERGKGRGTYAANGTMRVFRAIYNRARRQHPELPENPCVNIVWYKEYRRQSALAPEALAKWWRAVAKIGNPIRGDYLRFTLFTGLRRQNAAAVRWEHVDLKARTLYIPKPKSGRPFTLPLSDFLMELLEQRKEDNAKIFGEDNEWVFPAQTGVSGHIAEPKGKLRDPDKDPPAPGEERAMLDVKWNIHALRNTFVTVAESLDVSPYAIKLLVNHSTGQDVTAGYVNADVERLRAPMQKITDKLLAFCEGPAEVVALPLAAGVGR